MITIIFLFWEYLLTVILGMGGAVHEADNAGTSECGDLDTG